MLKLKKYILVGHAKNMGRNVTRVASSTAFIRVQCTAQLEAKILTNIDKMADCMDDGVDHNCNPHHFVIFDRVVHRKESRTKPCRS